MGPTGDIISMKKLLKIPKKEQEKYIEIPEQYLDTLQHMNRADRRKWYRDNKH